MIETKMEMSPLGGKPMDSENSRVSRCKCGLHLPIYPSTDAPHSKEWACAKCGAIYRGMFNTDAPAELWGNVRPEFMPPMHKDGS